MRCKISNGGSTWIIPDFSVHDPYHLTQALADAGDLNAVVDYAEMHASLAGEFLDLRQRPDHQALDPDEARGYAAGNALATAARSAGLNGVIYPFVKCCQTNVAAQSHAASGDG